MILFGARRFVITIYSPLGRLFFSNISKRFIEDRNNIYGFSFMVFVSKSSPDLKVLVIAIRQNDVSRFKIDILFKGIICENLTYS